MMFFFKARTGKKLETAHDTTDGARAESIAARWLVQQGLHVLTRNYRIHGGEIDLVCQDGPCLVFVEVRLRRQAQFGGAAASITVSKQRRLIQAAQHYLVRRYVTGNYPVCRFDCVLLRTLDSADVEWIQNAFSADGV